MPESPQPHADPAPPAEAEAPTPEPPAGAAPTGEAPAAETPPTAAAGGAAGSAMSTLVTILKESTTTLLALVIAGVTIYMLVHTYRIAEEFAEKKDIMLYGLPILGSIIGYYFGRVPAERRAEAAEADRAETQATAREAQQTASAAQQEAAEEGRARQEAEKKVSFAKSGVERAMRQMQPAVAAAPRRTLGGEPGAPEPAAAGGQLGAYYELEALSRLL